MAEDFGKSVESIRSAWAILAGGSPIAAQALVDIAAHGKSEMARVLASNAVLDRVGIAPKQEMTFRVIPTGDDGITQQLSPAQVIRNRLAEVKANTLALSATAGEPVVDDLIVDAELMPMPEDDGWS